MLDTILGKKKKRGTSSSSGSTATISTVQLDRIIDRLKNQKNRESTRKIYYSVWKNFNHFCIQLDLKPETWEERLVLFVGYLVKNDLKSTTIKSYISAIKSVLLDDGIELNENKYLISSLTRACKYVNDGMDKTRQDKTSYQEKPVASTTDENRKNQPYLCNLYRALFLTSYYGLFRISKVTSGPGMHPIKARDVHIGENKDKMLFILRTSKTHWKDNKTAHGENFEGRYRRNFNKKMAF